jgi:hypothetical protein
MKHRWTHPTRPDLNNTFRSCVNCGLVKITRHEPDNQLRHWLEFERDGVKIAAMPKCEAA